MCFVPQVMARVLAAVVVALMCLSGAQAMRSQWRRAGDVHGDSTMRVTVGVALPEGAYDMLVGSCKSVSEPTSASYAQYLSRDQVAEMTASDKNVALVQDWLASAGVSDVTVSPTRDSLVAVMSVAQGEALFGVSMSLYNHVDVPRLRLVRSATEPTAVPSAVAEAIEVLVGVSDFPSVNRDLVAKHKKQTAKVARAKAAFAKAAPAATGTIQPPSTPTVGLMYVSDTQATLMTLFACGDSVSSTTVPCAGTDYPVESLEAEVYVNGKLMESALSVPLSAVSAEIQPTPSANNTVYNVAIPYPVSEFQYVNVSIRAVNSAGKSEFATLPWKNQYGMNNSLHGMLATPYVTPELLTKFYGLGDMPSIPNGLSQAVAEFGEQWYSPVDLATFYKRFELPVSQVTVVGNNDGPQSGGEATLDIQYITGVAPGVDTTFWSVTPGAAAPDQAFLFEWASQVNAASNPPLLTSISYGLGEVQYVQSGFGPTYISRTNVEFLKLCSRGSGILVAAGDAGASNDGHGSNTCSVMPDFPSSSPWVTTVSASFISNAAPARPGQNAGEVAVSIPNGVFWTTGGGFSSEPSCEQPWYQQDAVATYLSRGDGTFPPNSMFNSTLRAYPDVSAIGHNLMCEWAGTLVSIDGTSASSPIFAGILTRLNAARLNAGKNQLGFANPLLYSLAASNPSVFYDITIGDNKCAGFTCCEYGYACEKGFDAVSGLGSVGDFALLEKLVVSMA